MHPSCSIRSGDRESAREERALQVDVDRAIPLRLGHLRGRALDPHSCGADQHIQSDRGARPRPTPCARSRSTSRDVGDHGVHAGQRTGRLAERDLGRDRPARRPSPSARNRAAIARPMPPLPPVISTTRRRRSRPSGHRSHAPPAGRLLRKHLEHLHVVEQLVVQDDALDAGGGVLADPLGGRSDEPTTHVARSSSSSSSRLPARIARSRAALSRRSASASVSPT